MNDKLSRRAVLGGIASGALAISAVGTATAGGESRYLAATSGPAARERIEGAGFAVDHELAGGRAYAVSGGANREDDLAGVRGVQGASVDVTFELEGPVLQNSVESAAEPFYPYQWDKQVTNAAAAHDRATGDGTTIAVVDTGIDASHPDLAPNVNVGASRLFRLGEVSPDATDPEGHGTHVAGIAGAARNDVGVVGTAPEAELVSLRVFYPLDVDGDGTKEFVTTAGDVYAAVDYAAEIGADVANMSLGTVPMPPQANAGGLRAVDQRVTQSAVRRGALVVSSVGNAATNLQQGGGFVLPGSVPGAMAVSATGPNDEATFYTNYGTNVIDVGAPGGGYETLEKTMATDTEWPFPYNLVLSTMAPDSAIGRATNGSTYLFMNGTSMAAPQVAGAAALLRERHPGANPKQVQQAIEQGATGAKGKSDPTLGAGRLDVVGALDAAGTGGGSGRGN